MRLHNNIIKSALLGTRNRRVEVTLFPNEVQEVLPNERRQEQLFLDGLTLNIAYANAGRMLHRVPPMAQKIPKAPAETLPYCSEQVEAFLKMILEENRYALVAFLPALVRQVNDEQFIFPPLYFSKLKKPNQETIQAFGERGRWVSELQARYGNPALSRDYLSMKKSERNAIFLELLKENREEALRFLEEIFDAETPVGRLSYLKAIIETIDEHSTELLNFIERYLEEHPSTSKSHKNLSYHLFLARLATPKSETFEHYYEEIFSKIWTEEKGAYLVKDRPELEELFAELPSFDGNVEYLLRFIFSLTPVEYWAKLLAMEYGELLKTVRGMPTTYVNEDFILAMGQQAVKSRNKALIYAYLDLKETRISEFSFLEVFDEDELFTFVENYSHILVARHISLLKMIQGERRFHKAWSGSFSKKVLEPLFEHDHFYGKEWVKAIWSIAPYLHDEGFGFIERALAKPKRPSHWNALEEELPHIIKFKKIYNRLER